MQADEREAFDAFARGRMRELLRFAHLLTGDPHRAADLVQDALERTLISWHRVERKDDPEAYVRRAIVNRHISVWRRTRRERLVAETPEGSYDEPRGRDDELWAALAGLPPRQRAVLVLRFYEDARPKAVQGESLEADTAAALGCTVGTVKSQTWKALARLRTQVTRADLADPGGMPSWTR